MHKYTLPELKYKTDALSPHYTSEALEIHHQKHHAGYVKNLNKTQVDLADARSNQRFAHLRQLQKDFAFNLSGHRLHSLLWNSLSPEGGGEPPETVALHLDKDFGSVNAFREQFSQAALGIQGSGWVSVSREPISEGLIIEQIYDHQDNMGAGTEPLLVLDMWEHAFYMQYRNEKAKWVDAFWEVVNWRQLVESIAADSVTTAVAA